MGCTCLVPHPLRIYRDSPVNPKHVRRTVGVFQLLGHSLLRCPLGQNEVATGMKRPMGDDLCWHLLRMF